MSFEFRSRRVVLVLGSVVALAVATWLANAAAKGSSSPSMTFIHSHFTLPPGWSAGTVMRARAFPVTTNTLTIRGPQRLHIQLTYTPGTPTRHLGWIPLRPTPFGVNPGNRVIATKSLYVNALWNSTSNHRAFLTSTVETLRGTYGWSTSPVLPSQQALLLHFYRSWHYPQPVTVTDAVHAIIHLSRNDVPQIPITVWRRQTGAMLTAGIPATGQAPWYLFTTDDHGQRWHLAHVSTLGPASRRTGFPATSPSDALIALALTSPRRIWIAQTINCMAGPEAHGGTITLAQSTNGGQSWRIVANRIHELAGYCPTALRLSATPRADQPTVHLTERNAAGTPMTRFWPPRQWEGQ